MKRYFVTGLVILLPLALTIWIVLFFVDVLTDPFVGIFQSIFEGRNFLVTAPQVQLVVSKISILILLFFLTVGLGFIARWFLFHYFIRLWDGTLHRIPLINSIYKTSQDVVKTLFTTEARPFKQVVFVSFPHMHAKCIGFITGEETECCQELGPIKKLVVFVPTAPNPISGFILLLDKDEVVYSNMKVDEAFKFIFSCGVIQPEFRITPYTEKDL